MLIGPNAPIVFEDIRASYMADTYDFYKPDPADHAPTINGPLSLQEYLKGLTNCVDKL
jgi:hydroxymethylglutaryl-CoA synthase